MLYRPQTNWAYRAERFGPHTEIPILARFPILPLAILAVACLLAVADDGATGIVRWIAVVSLTGIAAWLWLRTPAISAPPQSAPSAAAPSSVRHTAVLLVEVSAANGAPLRAQDVELVKEMVEQCVRATDTVRQAGPDTLSVHLPGVTWDMADQIGCRIRDHVQELIIFDEKGLLITAIPKVGGALAPGGDAKRLEDQARVNLDRVKALNAPGLLLTPGA